MNNTPDNQNSGFKIKEQVLEIKEQINDTCSDKAPNEEPECHKKRDGETNIAVGLFLFALGIPVLLGTLGIDDNVRAATVNAVCGLALLLTGGGWIAYGWRQFKQSTGR
ncbi:MAG: hypothetical protein GX130_09680 [Candidatus Hydrogenedens sp.]|jgi:hypothetical protein|nr:hypothetical protein [Candidatus Hydrogenedens sp.]